MTTIIYIMYIGRSAPFKNKALQGMDLFNEFTILLTMYCFFVFTDFVQDPKQKTRVSYFLIIITCFMMFVNMLPIVISSLYGLRK